VVGFRAPAPGDVRVEERRAQMKLKMHRGGPPWPEKLDQGLDQQERVRITILAVAHGGVVTKKRIELLEQRRERRVGERIDRTPSPVLGKAYDLDYSGNEVLVSRADGTPVSAYEQATLLVEYAGGGRRNGLGAILPKRPLNVGETFELPPEGAIEMFGQPGKQAQAGALRLTLKAADTVHATFAVEVRLTLTESGMTTTRDLDGTVTLERATGWPTAVHIQGTLELTGQTQAPGTILGEGTMALDVVTQYER
jgi:hypothetical protein